MTGPTLGTAGGAGAGPGPGPALLTGAGGEAQATGQCLVREAGAGAGRGGGGAGAKQAPERRELEKLNKDEEKKLEKIVSFTCLYFAQVLAFECHNKENFPFSKVS